MNSLLSEPLPMSALVDEETGIVKRVRPVLVPPGAPHRYVSRTAQVSDARAHGNWPADRVALGTTFGDDAQAWTAAVAESVERYCGNYLPAVLDPDDLREGSADELRHNGLEVLDPGDMPQFAPWQLSRSGFQYAPSEAATPRLWAACFEDGKQVWAPAALTHLNWRQQRFRHLPRVHHLNYAGIATGQGLDDAAERALLEVIERDALELWWHLDLPARGVDPASVPGLREDMAGADLQVSLVEMPSAFAPCLAALVHDPATGVRAAGFACRPDPVDAARKAVLEAVHTWIYSLGTVDADGWVYRSVEAGLMAPGLYLPHRHDRRYLDDAGPRMEHVIDLGAHVQVWLDPRVHDLARRFDDPALGVVSVDELPRVDVTEIQARLTAHGHRVLVRDLTTSDVAETRLRVARVLITGLVPNAPAAFAYLGCPRLLELAHRHGRHTSTDGPGDLTLIPPPHM